MLAGLTRQPELLVVDLEMPTMDGSQLLEQLQKRGIKIPILVVSSREDALLELVLLGSKNTDFAGPIFVHPMALVITTPLPRTTAESAARPEAWKNPNP